MNYSPKILKIQRDLIEILKSFQSTYPVFLRIAADDILQRLPFELTFVSVTRTSPLVDNDSNMFFKKKSVKKIA